MDQRAGVGLSLDVATRHSAILGSASAQVVLLIGLFATPVQTARWPVVVAHLAVVALALVVDRGWLPTSVYFLGIYAVLILDLAVAPSAASSLGCAALWLAVITAATPVLVNRGPSALVFSAAATVLLAGSTAVVEPSWSPTAPLILLTLSPGMVVFAAVFMGALRVYAARADAAERAAAQADEELLLARTRQTVLAEHARVMHDSVINTLGALAGPSRRPDHRAARRRCAADVQRVRRMRAGGPTARRLGDVLRDPAIAVRTSGISLADLDRWERRLAPAVRDALASAVCELLQNTARHAHTDHALVDLLPSDDRLVVTVADAGVGFDPSDAGWGINESVIGRSRAAGIATTLHSEPGAGTRVVLAAPTTHAEPTGSSGQRPESAETLRRLGCWTWAAGISVFAVISDLVVHQGRPTWSLASAVLVALACVAARRSLRGRERLPTAAAVALVATVPVAFGLSYASVTWGAAELFEWRPIGLSPLLVVLLVTARSARPTIAAATVLVAAATAAAVTGSTDAVVAVSVTLELSQLAGWVVFLGVVDTLVAAFASSTARIVADRVAIEAAAAGSAAAERWTRAGCDHALDLLERIADGRADVDDPRIQEQCGAEEHHLRQLLLLRPTAHELGEWFSRALGLARERSVRLVVRTGDDLLPADISEAFGHLLIGAVRRARPHDEVTVGIFTTGTPTILLVGPPHVAGSVGAGHVPAPWTVEHSHFGTQALTEIKRAPTHVENVGGSPHR